MIYRVFFFICLILVPVNFIFAAIPTTSMEDGHDGEFSASGLILTIDFTTSPPWTQYIRSKDIEYTDLSGEIYCDWTSASYPNDGPPPCTFDFSDSGILSTWSGSQYYYYIAPYSGSPSANFYIEETCGDGAELVLESAGTSGCAVPPATPSTSTATSTPTNTLNYQEQLLLYMVFLTIFAVPAFAYVLSPIKKMNL